MRHDNNIVTVRILGKFYNIKCPKEQAQALENAAHSIEEKLRDIKKSHSGSATDMDRLLVVLALNLCHELNLLKNEKTVSSIDVASKLQGIQTRIQSFLACEEEMLV